MHKSAYKNAKKFYEKYCRDNIQNKFIIDFGSLDVNGSMRPIFKDAKKYIGLDQSFGKNVDIVSSCHSVPFDNNSFDIAISSSCFEHDSMFWLTFLEMCRVTKPKGYIYIQAPSDGPYHAYPVDNWRFLKDSWKSLEKWAIINHYKIKLFESFVDDKAEGSVFHDSVGIYKKLLNYI